MFQLREASKRAQKTKNVGVAYFLVSKSRTWTFSNNCWSTNGHKTNCV